MQSQLYIDIIYAVRSFESEDAFLKYVSNDTILKDVLAGVIFSGIDQFSNAIPDTFRVTFRFHADPITVTPSESTAFAGL